VLCPKEDPRLCSCGVATEMNWEEMDGVSGGGVDDS